MWYSESVSIFAYCFNPRLPGGRRRSATTTSHSTFGFQSTPSGGKATEEASQTLMLGNVSIHAFRGEGDLARSSNRALDRRFNPRLPGGRRRCDNPSSLHYQSTFQSTPSGGKATVSSPPSPSPRSVSIHAFRGEGDVSRLHLPRVLERFNPRLPGGRRPTLRTPALNSNPFQSTPSGGKATAVRSLCGVS